MSSVNKVILLGNLVADGETRTFGNGGRVFNMRIATNERWKDKNSGEQREKVEYHNVAIFSDGLVTVCEKYLKKGSTVYIEGKLQTRKYQDQSGNDRYTTEIVLQGFDSKLVMLGGKSDSQGDHNSTGTESRGGDQGGGYGGDLDNGDDLPF